MKFEALERLNFRSLSMLVQRLRKLINCPEGNSICVHRTQVRVVAGMSKQLNHRIIAITARGKIKDNYAIPYNENPASALCRECKQGIIPQLICSPYWKRA